VFPDINGQNSESIQLSNDNYVQGLSFYEPTLKVPLLSIKYLRTILKNKIGIQHEIKTIGENKLVKITLELGNLFETIEISGYEIYISDEDMDFQWLGLKKFKKMANEPTQDKIFFSFISNKTGMVEVNKICINIFTKNVNEKPIHLNCIPAPLIIEL
jgi:hypothetical protein